MSNKHAPQQSAPNSDTTTEPATESVKHRKSDFIINAVSGEGRNETWTKIGAAWQNEKGYITPKYQALPCDHDRVVFQPREELERLRQERKDRESDQNHNKDIPRNP